MSVGYPLADKKTHYGTKAYLKSDSDMLFLFHRKLPYYETGKIMGKGAHISLRNESVLLFNWRKGKI